jgi:hypothetical protein
MLIGVNDVRAVSVKKLRDRNQPPAVGTVNQQNGGIACLQEYR